MGIDKWFLLRINHKWFSPFTSLAFMVNDSLVDSLHNARTAGPYANYSAPAILALQIDNVSQEN